MQNKQCEGDRKLNGKHFSKELEIFEAAGKKTDISESAELD